MSGIHISFTGAVNLGVLVAGVKRRTVEQWITRGLITRHEDGYDPDEILHWIATRDPEALRVRAGIRRGDAPTADVA